MNFEEQQLNITVLHQPTNLGLPNPNSSKQSIGPALDGPKNLVNLSPTHNSKTKIEYCGFNEILQSTLYLDNTYSTLELLDDGLIISIVTQINDLNL